MTPGTKVAYSDEEVRKNPFLSRLEGIVRDRGNLSERFVRVRWRGFSDDDVVLASKLKVIG